MKRLVDIVLSAAGLLLLSPVLLVVMFLVWWEDKYSPFYVAPRVGKKGVPFRMVKMRSMVKGADKIGASSTSNSDRRITPVGHFIRKFKIDEITQLWNVLWGDMSLVGPRPQVQAGVDVYTERERDLLALCPGITDFASIVFADEGAILKDSVDPDADYDMLIRPWKSRLGLIYVERRSLLLDLQIVGATILALVSREKALEKVTLLLDKLHAPPDVVQVARRNTKLAPATPPDGAFRTAAADSA